MKNITPIILILASIGIFFGFVKPQYSKAKIYVKELETYQKTLDQAKELDQKVKTLEGQIATFDKEDLEGLEKMLPERISDVDLIIEINNIASNFGLGIKDISIDKAASEDVATAKQANESFNTVDFSFGVTTSYQTFLTFLEGLEKSLRLVDVVSVTFAPGEGELYTFKVSLRTYWMK